MFDHSPRRPDDERHRHNRLALENLCKFSGMFLGGSLRPQGLVHAHELVAIRQLSEPDANIRH